MGEIQRLNGLTRSMLTRALEECAQERLGKFPNDDFEDTHDMLAKLDALGLIAEQPHDGELSDEDAAYDSAQAIINEWLHEQQTSNRI